MTRPTAYHQLGKFIADFQHIETALVDLLFLVSDSSNFESTSALIINLGYSQLLKTADVMFAMFIDSKKESNLSDKEDFHKLMDRLAQLGKRRNELVHSSYMRWINVDGDHGLIRKNLKRDGQRCQEEELLPEAFNKDLEALSSASQNLEKFRLKVIDYLYPDVINN